MVSGGQLQRLRGYGTVGSQMLPVVDPGQPIGDYVGDFQAMHLWATQPSLRKVVDFIARNIASLSQQVFDRREENNRVHVTDHPLAQLVAQPMAGVGAYRWWHSIIVDQLLYDRWCALKVPRANGGLELLRIPASRVNLRSDGVGRVIAVQVHGEQEPIDPAACVYDYGYGQWGTNGVPPVRTLWALLEEASEAVRWRRAVWRRGARVPAVIRRPPTAPEWSKDARDRFSAEWSRYREGGGGEGGTPILEDGMELDKVDVFSARDTQDLEGRQLTDAEVASAYHIAPELVGARAGTYSNIDAFHQQLYRDALGPIYLARDQVMNVMVCPDLDPSGKLYVESNVEAKLRGSFETQAQLLQSAVGAPWMLRSEARARMNLPLIENADELVTPLNVVVGGLANPRDTAPPPTEGVPPPKGLRAGTKAELEAANLGDAASETALLANALAAYYSHQRDSVLSALGAKAMPNLLGAYDTDRWNRTLSQVLFRHTRRLTAAAGLAVVERLGGNWEPSVADAYLAKAAESNAAVLNRATYQALADAIADPDWSRAVTLTFDGIDADQQAQTLATEAGGFGAHDAAKWAGATTKTWNTGDNPRASHAAMDGETVGLHEAFSNGGMWPGDPSLPDEERANCNCSVSYGSEPR